MTDQLPEPWYWMTDDRLRATFEEELTREVGPNHALANLSLRIVARRDDCDDVLVALDGGRVAQVHLTWTRRREFGPRWPEAVIYDSMDDWRNSCGE
ncbi:hypothetical protein LQG66_01550 [Bradyrhizobium ontarionense]|uniref:Uncharacterized protein n=1 Tax=Bradyrhizobium ontarionense TaxID=2898149 RepID=A0ABY3RE48_9BRAD|nr:hypothetical protein [Bradyrhizobium sp. A19]UFZ05032.1 hypothetical protein LQG66_01550 [Bradyrhizobium sp. A19]